jgi:hypothetical protein
MTEELKYQKLTGLNNRMEAELIKSLLVAHGIDAELFQESIGHTSYAVTVDGLGYVQIFVPKEKIKEARQLLKDYHEGLNTNLKD